MDASPAAVWATLLDEGRYLCSQRTMYRLLAGNGELRERRDQLTHPAYARPELLASQPNQVWSWDISKLKGPATWSYYYLYVVLDVFSRYVVAWSLQMRESGELAKDLIGQALTQQQVERGALTVHADRGSSMTSKPVAYLLADLGVTRTHNRPYASNDNPYSEAHLEDAQVPARLPRALRLDRGGARLLPRVLRLAEPRAPPLGDRPHGAGRRALRARQGDPRGAGTRPRCGVRAHPGALRLAAAAATGAAHGRVDQQARLRTRRRGGCSLIASDDRLNRLDRFRACSALRPPYCAI